MDGNLDAQNTPSSNVTFRAVVLGFLLVAAATVWSAYNVHILWSSGLSMEFFPVSAGFIFFALLLLNTLVKVVERKLPGTRHIALTGRELLTILIMLLVGSTIPTRGLVGNWIGHLACAKYWADAINQWERYLLPHLPWWGAVTDQPTAEAIYDGVIPGRPKPWGTLATPIFWWFGFFFALMAVNFFVVAILRRQWVEEERLTFPIAEVPVEMVRGMDTRGSIPAILKNRLFWFGMLFPVVHIGLRILHFQFPAVPGDPLRIMIWGSQLPLGFPRIWIQFDWAVAGFAFFSKLDILFSLVLFYWLYFVEQVIFTRRGISLGPAEKLFAWGSPVGYQMMGALFVMVLISLWLGRRHLKRVFIKAFRPSHDYDDSGELVSSRTAVFGLLAGLIYMGLWLSRAGLQLTAIVAFLPLYLFIIVGLTRAVAESGMIWFGAPGMAQHLMITAIGPASLRASSLVTLGMTWCWHQDMRVAFMPAVAHSTRMSGLAGIRRRAIAPLVLAAALIAFGVGTFYTLQLCFQYGGRAMDRRMFGVWGHDEPFKTAKRCVSARNNEIHARMELGCADAAIEAVRTALSKPDTLKRRCDEVRARRKALLSEKTVAQALAQTADLEAALEAARPFGADAAPGADVKTALQNSLSSLLAWKKKYAHRDAEMQLWEYLEKFDAQAPLNRKTLKGLKYQLEAARTRITDRIELDRTLAEAKVLAFEADLLEKLAGKKSLEPKPSALSEKLVGIERVSAAADNLDLKILGEERRKFASEIPPRRGIRGLMLFASGAAVALVNYVMRLRLSWWPIHPMGIAFGTVWPMEVIWLSLLLAWLVKLIIIKTGGIRLYNKFKPFFLGFIVGGFFMTGLGSLVDTIFYRLPRGGHRLIYW